MASSVKQDNFSQSVRVLACVDSSGFGSIWPASLCAKGSSEIDCVCLLLNIYIYIYIYIFFFIINFFAFTVY